MSFKHRELKFCVYCLVDPNQTRRSIFYVGKARENTLQQIRWRHTNNKINLRKYRTIQRILKENQNFTIKVLKQGLTEAKSFILETFLIKSLKKLGFDLVNLTSGGEGTAGLIIKDHVRALRRQRMINNNPMKNKETAERVSKIKKKPIEQYSKNEELVARFESALDAEKTTGFSASNITSCCRGERKTAGGYKWRCSIVQAQ